MHRVRLALFLALLLLPTAALAVPCCEDSPGRERCEVDGDCPETPVGECLIAAGPAPVVPIQTWAAAVPADAPKSQAALVPASPGTVASPCDTRAEKIPLYLSLRVLRN